MKNYNEKPNRMLAIINDQTFHQDQSISYCAGFELEKWRCTALANHLMEWIADYALSEDELSVNHGNMYVRMQEAAVRIYTSDKYAKRGEVGEIALHAICRDFFETFPIAPRVFYLTASNDVVKSFDMVHVRYPDSGEIELWLGEAKLYEDSDSAISEAIASVKAHIDQGFLNKEKLIIGPQLSKDIPRYEEIRNIFSVQTSLDNLFETAVFPICIMATSPSTAAAKKHDFTYSIDIQKELSELDLKLNKSGLRHKIKIVLIYFPLASKLQLADAFDKKLKGLSA